MARPADSQIDLFGSAPASVVAPADVPASVHALASALPAHVRLGTSSWAFPGWSGLVYARPERAERLSKHGLAAYAQHPLLRTVGLDRTFYAPIARAEYAAYADAVPADFRFLVKAHAAVTTPGGLARLRRPGAPPAPDVFLDADYAAAHVVAPAVEGLGERLGVLLFQFPPLGEGTRALATLPARLGRFLAALPRGVPYAVEVRNASLLGDAQVAAYVDALEAGGATHGFTVHPTMPTVGEQAERLGPAVSLAGPVAVRWMLQRGHEYESARDAWAPFRELAAPDPVTRADVAALVDTLAAAQRPVLVIANNKAEGSAPRSLLELARLLAGRDGTR
jgi:uncharacterized protein YecE (DUF72 family)